jgi:hypothetical protein
MFTDGRRDGTRLYKQSRTACTLLAFLNFVGGTESAARKRRNGI